MLSAGSLAGCAPRVAPVDAALTCDARVLLPGEVRAKRIGCSAELVEGGEGRPGDWVLENAVARFVVRDTYAALTTLGEPGGTVVDAVRLDAAGAPGADLLTEWRPAADRSSIEAVNDADGAALRLPGVTYRLTADSDALLIDGAADGVLVVAFGAERTGATLRSADGAGFLGLDGATTDPGAQPRVTGATRLALTPESLWPDGAPLEGQADADAVIAAVDGVDALRVPVVDGVYAGWAPAGTELRGERAGCTYEGTVPVACAGLYVRVTDTDRDDLDAVVTDGADTWRLPRGGGTARVGPEARPLWIWAGPAYEALAVQWGGHDAEARALLAPAFDTEGWELLDLALEAAPDPDATRPVDILAALRAGEGVGFVVALADDEIPLALTDGRDGTLAVAGVRTDGWITSWPWTPTTRRAAHGAPDASGLRALDQLSIAGGGTTAARRLVVSADWVAAALGEADPATWSPLPDAVRLDAPDDVDALIALLDAYVDVVPVGPRTWVRRGSARNVPGVEAGLVDGPTSAGTGPRVRVEAAWSPVAARWAARVTVDAPEWAGMDRVALIGRGGRILGEQAVTPGEERVFLVRADEPYVLAVTTGSHARPWGDGSAWAVSSPVWLRAPTR